MQKRKREEDGAEERREGEGGRGSKYRAALANKECSLSQKRQVEHAVISSTPPRVSPFFFFSLPLFPFFFLSLSLFFLQEWRPAPRVSGTRGRGCVERPFIPRFVEQPSPLEYGFIYREFAFFQDVASPPPPPPPLPSLIAAHAAWKTRLLCDLASGLARPRHCR